MKKIFFMFLFMLLPFMTISYAADEPIYDPSYNSNDGAFYANGTNIVIDKDSDENTVITWIGGSQIVPSTVTIFAGGENGSNYENTNIIMNNGTVGHLVGGGVSVDENFPALVTNSQITVNNGTILGGIVGGGYLYSQVDNTIIIINDGIVASICGGGMASATVNGTYYSVGSEEDLQGSPNRTNKVTIVINNGTVNSPSLNYGLVYGGGQGYSFVGETEVIINGGDLSTAYVTAGGSNGYTEKSKVEINGGNINIFQSVNRGVVENANAEVNGGSIQQFYVGGENDDVSVTGTINSVEIALLDGQIGVLEAGKSNSTPLVIDQGNYVVLKTDDIEINNDNISSEEIEVNYSISMPVSTVRIREDETLKMDVIVKTIPSGYERLFDDIKFTSSDEDVATITEGGILTGLKKGETTITATVVEEQASCNVIVESAYNFVVIILVTVLILIILGIIAGYIL